MCREPGSSEGRTTMRRHALIVLAVLTASLGLAAAPDTASLAAAAGGAIDTATVNSVSCAAPGSCVVGGYSTNGASRNQAFVLSEQGARWGEAIQVPGLPKLSPHNSQVTSVSCGSAGNCSAGGWYQDASFRDHPFVASERNGHWGQVIEVSGTGALRLNIDVNSVSCPAPGDCAAVGGNLAFAVSERNGRWGRPIEIPGIAALNKGQRPAIASWVSCASAGNCTAVGSYSPRLDNTSAFVVTERHGRWGQAMEVPGLAALNKGQFSEFPSVSCRSVGNCAIAGTYQLASSASQAFVASERNGRWSKAIEVPGLASATGAGLNSVSCASAGNCAAGGDFGVKSGVAQAFVVSERGGRWGKAVEVPGIAALNAGGSATVTSVSCGSPGNCSAGGDYAPDTGGAQIAFVVSERDGHWGKAVEVPGLATLDTAKLSETNAVSCASAGNCVAGGQYTPRPAECPFSACPAFVASQKRGVWGKAQPVRFR